jgi:hypothetical protein
MRTKLAATGVAILALGAFTGAAAAGNGNGNGNGEAQGGPPAWAHSSTATADDTNGVKPGAGTAHDTSAPASSSRTKLYGNGKTAGEIATAAGYGSATLHGPGNSQPHKVLCGGHEVDVHALAAKGGRCGAPATATKATAAMVTATAVTARTAHPSAAPTATVAAAAVTTTPAPAPAPAPKTAAGVKGATVAVAAPKAHATHARSATPKRAGGVLGATAGLGSTAPARHLPFTGLSLWLYALAGVGLLVAGIGVTRSTRS